MAGTPLFLRRFARVGFCSFFLAQKSFFGAKTGLHVRVTVAEGWAPSTSIFLNSDQIGFGPKITKKNCDIISEFNQRFFLVVKSMIARKHATLLMFLAWPRKRETV